MISPKISFPRINLFTKNTGSSRNANCVQKFLENRQCQRKIKHILYTKSDKFSRTFDKANMSQKCMGVTSRSLCFYLTLHTVSHWKKSFWGIVSLYKWYVVRRIYVYSFPFILLCCFIECKKVSQFVTIMHYLWYGLLNNLLPHFFVQELLPLFTLEKIVILCDCDTQRNTKINIDLLAATEVRDHKIFER